MRTIRGVATSVALAAAVSGCSVYEDLTTSDFAKQDADAIVAAASEAMQDVSSLRLTGQVRDGGEQYFIDLSVDRRYFRPPYGDYDATSLGYLYDNGYYLSIWWTCDTHGWAGWGAQEIVDYCTTNIAEDEILLLHVGAGAVGDFEALPALIDFFRGQGYAFVTIEQMLQP
jgi:peptidoglycan/xylan/chitin deacetylase (PgdA/CDA1 family)